LTGNYIGEDILNLLYWHPYIYSPPDQIGPDNAPYGTDSEDDMEEDAHDLREVSSDVEFDAHAIELPSDDEDAE
jgi:hypothetical protein